MRAPDSRTQIPELEATSEVEDGRVVLRAPRPGHWRGAPLEGVLVTPHAVIGELEILGRLHRLRAPADAFGVVTELPDGRRLARRAVDRASRLMALDPEGVSGAEGAQLVAQERAEASGPVFRLPIGGRYYAQPSPGADPFVKPGDELKGGETVALVEVMKTFNRVQYDGSPARVAAVVPADGDDVENGDVLLRLEPSG